MDEKRDLKKRLKLWLKIGLPILFLAWIMLEAFLIGPIRLVLVEHDIPIAGLPEEWNGFRIVLLGDFHAGSEPAGSECVSAARPKSWC